MGGTFSCGAGKAYRAPENSALPDEFSSGVLFNAPRITLFSVKIRLEYFPINSAYSIFSPPEKSLKHKNATAIIRSFPTCFTDKISPPDKCLRKSMQKDGGTRSGGFSVSCTVTRAKDAFVFRISLSVPFFVYIIRVISSLSACDTRLTFPPVRVRFNSSASLRI